MELKTVGDFLVRNHIFNYDRGKYYLIKCINPEHEDRNPSMHIDKHSGKYYCFVCKTGGPLVKLMEHFGEKPISEDVSYLDGRIEHLRRKLDSISLRPKEKKDIIPPRDWHEAPAYRNVTLEQIQKFGCFLSNAEGFVNRFWITIKHYNKTIGFQGRSMDIKLEPKYLFYPQHIDLRPVIMGIDNVPKNVVILTEGMFDMLRLRSAGYPEACCIFGSYFNPEKVTNLLAHSIDIVITMYDGDKPGRAAAQQTKEIIKNKANNISVIDVVLDKDSDPGSLSDFEISEILRNSDADRILHRR